MDTRVSDPIVDRTFDETLRDLLLEQVTADAPMRLVLHGPETHVDGVVAALGSDFTVLRGSGGLLMTVRLAAITSFYMFASNGDRPAA